MPGDQAYRYTCSTGSSYPNCRYVSRIPVVSSGQYIGDLNGDGLTDFIFLDSLTEMPYLDYGSQVTVTTVDPASPHVCLSREAGADCRHEPMLATALVPRMENYLGPSSVTGQIAVSGNRPALLT